MPALPPLLQVPLLIFLLGFGAASPSLASPSPVPDASRPLAVPLHHLASRQYSPDIDERVHWLEDQAAGLRAKYASQLSERDLELHRRDVLDADSRSRARARARARKRQSPSPDPNTNTSEGEAHGRAPARRATADVTLANIGVDASYAAAVSIGTPAQTFLLILDTGSADLWVTGEHCMTATCRATTPFFEDESSSYRTNGEAFSITYGSGSAAGWRATDTVSMGGFTVNDQGFAVVNTTSANLITAPISGLMGLAFRTLSQTASTPFWQTLAASGSWDQQEMGFWMRRYRGTRGVQAVERNGGEFVMGGLNEERFTGDMNYISIPSTAQDYWRIAVQGMTVQNNSVNINTPQAAIDTGTTLIGVPSSIAQAIYAQVPGAQPMSAQSGFAGYYQYPCANNVSVTLQFGGLSYAIANADFNLGQFNQRELGMCTGAFFEMNLNSRSPIQWIVGATFLKNVYTAFRYSPPAIGFAALAEGSASGGVAGSTVTPGRNPNGTSTDTGGGSSGGGGGSGGGTRPSGAAGRGMEVGSGWSGGAMAGLTGVVLAALASGAWVL